MNQDRLHRQQIIRLHAGRRDTNAVALLEAAMGPDKSMISCTPAMVGGMIIDSMLSPNKYIHGLFLLLKQYLRQILPHLSNKSRLRPQSLPEVSTRVAILLLLQHP